MKNIKIRFVERRIDVDEKLKDYLIQKKTLLGWRYITYEVFAGYGVCIYNYCDTSKTKLLKTVLNQHFKVGRQFVTITEYPSLKLY